VEPTDREVTRQLGSLLKELRKAIGLKQEELAAEINASRSFVTQVETGRMEVPRSRLREITDALLEHIGEISVTEVDPTLVIALRRLKRAVSSIEDIPAEHAKHDAFIAFYETARIFTRLHEMLIAGDKQPAGISVPLVGLLLLFPEAETYLLIHLLSPVSQPENTDKLRFEIFANHFIVRALCSANQMLEFMTGQPNMIVELAQESLTSDEQQLQKVALLRKMHSSLAQDSPLGPFIDAILREQNQSAREPPTSPAQ
jgi:transcriptional regulator with XRE-family HTH domain